MTAAVKALGLKLLTLSPVYGLLRRRALAADPVTILCYHTLRPAAEPLDAWTVLPVEAFRAQIAALRESYDIVSLDDALAPRKARGRPRVVLTFDDGEVGMVDHLLPIVRAEALPVTVYVATAQIETGVPYWFDRVMNALQGGGRARIDVSGLGRWDVGPARGKARWGEIGAILEALKDTDPAQRDGLADAVVAQAGPMADGFRPLQPMTPDQLRDLAAEPNVTIGAHSHGHELLDQIPAEAARASIARSRDLLRDWTGREIRHFAYPNGNYAPGLMTLLEALGFASATILEDRLMTPDAAPMALPRVAIGRYDPLPRVRLRLVGV